MNYISRSNKRELTRTELNNSLLSLECIACEHILDGWVPYLLTFTFEDMPKVSEGTRIRIMSAEIESLYNNLLPRIVRKPRTQPRPILIAAPDMPVPKSDKTQTTDHVSNDGLHFHAIYLMPIKTRLTVDLKIHLQERWFRYTCPETRMLGMDIQPITETPWKAVSYVLKSLSRGRFNYDETILILPQTVSELPDQKTLRHPIS